MSSPPSSTASSQRRLQRRSAIPVALVWAALSLGAGAAFWHTVQQQTASAPALRGGASRSEARVAPHDDTPMAAPTSMTAVSFDALPAP